MTEQRLIDIKPLMTNGWHLVQTGESNRFIRSMSLADVPVVEAREVVHAKWNYDGTCDNCKAQVLSNHTKFCPACGAKMCGE